VRIVIDDAVPWLEEAFGPLGVLRPRAAQAIDREALASADALIVRSVTRVDPDLLEGSSIRFVGSATAGEDHIDRDGLEAQGITVANAPGCNAQAVADFVVASLAHARRWRVGGAPGPVGVIGLGYVGRRVTRTLRALGYDVMVCDPPLAERRAAGQAIEDDDLALANMARFERLGSLEALLESSFIITVHVPLTRGGEHPTWHLLSSERIERLRHGQLLINTCRGGVIEDKALPRWMSEMEGKAFLDVWEGEPLPREELLQAPTAVQLASPHVAGYSLEGKVAATRMVHEALSRFMGREPCFDGRAILEKAGRQELHCSDTNAAHDWRPWVAAAIPLLSDDRKLRAIARRPEAERAEAFEELRRGYSLRRELSAFTIRDALLDAETHRCLSALGIDV